MRESEEDGEDGERGRMEDVLSLDSHQTEHRVRDLLALNQAAIAITGELDNLLRKIVDVARELPRAAAASSPFRYLCLRNSR